MANTVIPSELLADDSVTLDKMAGLARGKIIYGDASGNPAALALGTSGQVLKSDGTDIAWATDAAGTITSVTNFTDNRVITSSGSTTLNGEANLTFDGSTLDVTGTITTDGPVSINSASGYGNIEIGGASGGFIDFKTPFADDYDARIIYGGSNFSITTNADQPILLKHNNSTVLTTSSTGVDVTGEVTTDGLTSSSTILVQESDSTTRAIRLTSDANEGFLQVYKDGVQKVQIRADGNNFIIDNNFGLGTSTPSATLDVDGTIKLDGNYPVGSGNCALGDDALGSLTDGGFNTAIGRLTLTANTSGIYNTALGNTALQDNVTGNRNVAVGMNALANNTVSDNTAVGYAAAQNNTTGTSIVAIGKDALLANTTGFSNVAVGSDALTENTIGNQNVAVGTEAMRDNVAADRNVAIGRAALKVMTSATTADTYNTAVGYFALTSTTSGAYNTALGASALNDNTTGINNTASGYRALFNNTTGNSNTALSGSALKSNTTGSNNTAAGLISMFQNTTGLSNTAIGQGALRANTTASNNTAVGQDAGSGATTGGNNVFIGHNAQGGGGGARSYSITIGPGLLSAGDYFTTFGEGSGANRVYNKYNANATWTKASDLRYKEEIADNTDCGLAFINDLRPVTYKWKPRANIDPSLPDYNPDETERRIDEKMYGLIAQEVKQAMDNHNITDFAGWDETENGIQGISQEMFVHPLIKAVQELSAKNDALEARIQELEE